MSWGFLCLEFGPNIKRLTSRPVYNDGELPYKIKLIADTLHPSHWQSQ
jgi:hypothetical protein